MPPILTPVETTHQLYKIKFALQELSIALENGEWQGIAKHIREVLEETHN